MNKKSTKYQSQSFGGTIVFDKESNQKRMQLNAPKLWQHFLNSQTKIGDKISFYCTNKRPKRTEAQNRYYFLYLSLIASNNCGHTVEELHIWAKGKFLSMGITEVFGQKTRIVKSSTDLNVSEFCEFLARIEESTEILLPDTEPFLKPLSHEEYKNLKGRQLEIYRNLLMKVK